MYKANAQRVKSKQKKFENYDDYLLSLEMTAEIEEFKSMHINLIGAVEQEFKMRFKMKEVSSMKTSGK